MSKHYRVLKDTFLWDEGAILVYDDGAYKAISDIWNKLEEQEEWITALVVEHSPEWFERVYEISIVGKVRYLAKDKAKQAMGDLYDNRENR